MKNLIIILIACLSLVSCTKEDLGLLRNTNNHNTNNGINGGSFIDTVNQYGQPDPKNYQSDSLYLDSTKFEIIISSDNLIGKPSVVNEFLGIRYTIYNNYKFIFEDASNKPTDIVLTSYKLYLPSIIVNKNDSLIISLNKFTKNLDGNYGTNDTKIQPNKLNIFVKYNGIEYKLINDANYTYKIKISEFIKVRDNNQK